MTAKVTAALNPETLARIVTATVSARQNNQDTEFMDGLNRVWFIGCATVDNHSKVLIQVRRGETLREAYLSTHDFTSDAAENAAQTLDGALQ